MKSEQRLAMCSIATIAFSPLASGIGAVSRVLGAPVGAIVLGEWCGLACVVAFTLLMWAAIQDGKHPDRGAAE